MDNIVKELEKLKSSIDDAKTQIAILSGRKEEALKRLKEEHKLRDLSAAEKWLEKTKVELEKQEDLILKSFKKLQENYEW